MHVKRVSGQWMQVQVVTPSDYCADEEGPRRRKETVWIRFLDQIVTTSGLVLHPRLLRSLEPRQPKA